MPKIINVPGLGKRAIRTARKAGPCAGWVHRSGHTTIEPGDQYWESEMDPYHAGGWAMRRCCMECLPEGFENV